MKTLKLNDSGKKFLVEDCQKVSIKTFIANAKTKLKEALLRVELQHQNLNIQIGTSPTHRNGIRYWFICPLCRRRAGILYIHPITSIFGCRKCLNLEYRSRRYKGMIEMDGIKG